MKMKNTLKMALIASAICTAGFVGIVPASAQPTGFSFRAGDVSIAYSDGYYDHRNRWHHWRDGREHSWYRSNYRNRYYDRDRVSYGYGRRDNDRDGIPNRYDRDRDNDGTPNRYDRRPNNPYRD
jgi:hypothetical protein